MVIKTFNDKATIEVDNIFTYEARIEKLGDDEHAVLEIIPPTNGEFYAHMGDLLIRTFNLVKGQFIICPQGTAVPYVQAISERTGIPYVVLKKALRVKMGYATSTLRPCKGVLDKEIFWDYDEELLKKFALQPTILFDDVTWTGKTMDEMTEIAQRLNMDIVQKVVCFRAGDQLGNPEFQCFADLPFLKKGEEGWKIARDSE